MENGDDHEKRGEHLKSEGSRVSEKDNSLKESPEAPSASTKDSESESDKSDEEGVGDIDQAPKTRDEKNRARKEARRLENEKKKKLKKEEERRKKHMKIFGSDGGSSSVASDTNASRKVDQVR